MPAISGSLEQFAALGFHYHPSGKRFLLRFREKGGKEKELPVHHKLEELFDETSRRPASSLYETSGNYRAGHCDTPTLRTCLKDGSSKPDCRLTIRLTRSGRPVSPNFLENEVTLKPLSESQATPTAEPQNSTIAAARRFCSRIWSECGTDLRTARCT
jgi:hypothetical protein